MTTPTEQYRFVQGTLLAGAHIHTGWLIQYCMRSLNVSTSCHCSFPAEINHNTLPSSFIEFFEFCQSNSISSFPLLSEEGSQFSRMVDDINTRTWSRARSPPGRSQPTSTAQISADDLQTNIFLLHVCWLLVRLRKHQSSITIHLEQDLRAHIEESRKGVYICPCIYINNIYI